MSRLRSTWTVQWRADAIATETVRPSISLGMDGVVQADATVTKEVRVSTSLGVDGGGQADATVTKKVRPSTSLGMDGLAGGLPLSC